MRLRTRSELYERILDQIDVLHSLRVKELEELVKRLRAENLQLQSFIGQYQRELAKRAD